MDRDIVATRERLLDATLPHVAFDGWSTTALAAGAADLGLDRAVLLNAFPGGPAELMELFSDVCDRSMLAGLEGHDLTSMKVRDRIALAVRLRLGLLAPHKEAVRRGLSFLALPQNAALGTRCLYRTVDAMWYAAGDTATDYNHYSKRLLLAGVYGSTLLVWLDDRSPGGEATWAFLERRIAEVLKLGGTLGRTLGRLLDLPDRILRRGAGAWVRGL